MKSLESNEKFNLNLKKRSRKKGASLKLIIYYDEYYLIPCVKLPTARGTHEANHVEVGIPGLAYQISGLENYPAAGTTRGKTPKSKSLFFDKM